MSQFTKHIPSIVLGLVGGAFLTAAGVAVASRNAAGTYSLATGPYVTGTTISATAVNSEFSDIATELTSSLDRSGRGGMLSNLRGIDGTLAAPAFSWTSETGSGLWRNGASDIRMSVAGALRENWTATGAAVTGTFSSTSDMTATTKLGVGAAPTNIFDVAVGGSATTTFGNWLEAALADGSTLAINFGKSTAAGGSGLMVYTKSATAANSTYCLGVAGGSASSLCVDGNDKVLSHSLTIGSSGTAISASLRGTATFNPGTVGANTCGAVTVTVTGAVQGSECSYGFPGGIGTMVAACSVTAASTCVVNFCNTTGIGITPVTGNAVCRVWNP